MHNSYNSTPAERVSPIIKCRHPQSGAEENRSQIHPAANRRQ